MRRLCIEQYHDAARESAVYCVRPGRGYCIRRDRIRHGSWGAHVIRRWIWIALLCPPIYLASPARSLLVSYFWSDAGVRSWWRAWMPLCRDHGVVGRPYRALVMKVWMLHPLIGGATGVLGSFWRGVRVHTLRPRGPRSICRPAGLDQLEAVAAFSLDYLLWPVACV